jgi:hypothetical protein
MSKRPEEEGGYSLEERLKAVEEISPEMAREMRIISTGAAEAETGFVSTPETDPFYTTAGGATSTAAFQGSGIHAGMAGAGDGGGDDIPEAPAAAAAGAMPGGGDGPGGDGAAERYEKFMERMFGVTKGQFQDAVQGLSRTLELWNRNVRPLIDSSQKLNREQVTATRQLARWVTVNERAMRQGGWGTEMETTVSGGAGLQGAGDMPPAAGYEEVQRAMREMQISQTAIALGGGPGGGGPTPWQRIWGQPPVPGGQQGHDRRLRDGPDPRCCWSGTSHDAGSNGRCACWRIPGCAYGSRFDVLPGC